MAMGVVVWDVSWESSVTKGQQSNLVVSKHMFEKEKKTTRSNRIPYKHLKGKVSLCPLEKKQGLHFGRVAVSHLQLKTGAVKPPLLPCTGASWCTHALPSEHVDAGTRGSQTRRCLT